MDDACSATLTEHLLASMTIEIPANPELKLFGRIGETPEQFAARCQAAAARRRTSRSPRCRQVPDQDLLGAAPARHRRQRAGPPAEARAGAISSDAMGLLGGLFGGRRTSVSTAARRASAPRGGSAPRRTGSRSSGPVADLQAELAGEMDAHPRRLAGAGPAVEQMSVTLAKSDVRVATMGLVWIPTGT